MTRTEEGVALPAPEEVLRGHVVGPGLWAFTVLLALVGGAALLLAGGLAVLWALLGVGDPALDRDVSEFAAAARHLPGVRAATATPGVGDLGTTPQDVYADVRLERTCTTASVAATADRLRAIMRHERDRMLHPTIWCRARGMTVSPVAAVTAERLAVFDLLAADHGLRGGELVAAQRGDDPSPDLDDTAVRLVLHVDPRSTASAASRWLERIRHRLPDVTVVATTGAVGEYLDTFTVADGDWTVVVAAKAAGTAAILRTAARLEREPAALGAYLDGPLQRGGVLTSDASVLGGLARSMPDPPPDGGRFSLTVLLAEPRR